MKLFFFALGFVFTHSIIAQMPASEGIVVMSINEVITADGELSEAAWAAAIPKKNFTQYFPTDSLPADYDTEIYFLSDDKNLYVGIKCYAKGNNYLVTSLKRDFRAGGQDNITLVFDTFNDKTNAYFFGINPQGVNREGLIANGGNQRSDFSESWDHKWSGNTKIYDGYYTAELVIPFNTIRFKDNNDRWGFQAYRFDTQANENTVASRVPRNQVVFNLAFAEALVFENAPKKNGANVAFIPYVSAAASKNFVSNQPTGSSAEIGGDIKVGITAGLNLDLTINPDFSQVEVDRQVTNVDRFEIFFPERRQFFLENEDLFGGFGFGTINPFFSRRIGVGIDTSTGVNVQNRILGGMRLSGKIGQDTRVGLLNMQTAANKERGLPASNFSVAVLQQKVLKRSNIGAIFVNKNVLGEDLASLKTSRYNRVAGIDFNYASADNKLTGKIFGHTSFTEGQNKPNLAHGFFTAYSVRRFTLEWNHQYIGNDYNAEVGFVRRKDLFRIGPSGSLNFYPQNNFINEYAFEANAEILYRPAFGKTDHQFSFVLNTQFANTSRLFLRLSNDYLYLFNDFDPTGTDAQRLAAGTDYTYTSGLISYSTDSRKPVSLTARGLFGEYFNGSRVGFTGMFRWQYPPRGFVSIDFTYNTYNMPYLTELRRNYLIGPRVDYTFSKSLFFTTFIQYNSQTANTNINARLQWRFAPVSDFYLVYTDNYLTSLPNDIERGFNFDIQNRAVVAKLSYWLNI